MNLSNLDALVALAEAGTMTRAATRLRISQSAVSKRIAALTDELGFRVLERDGRRVRLSPAGAEVLARAAPLLAELRHALVDQRSARGGVVSLAVSESILASWGPAALAQVSAGLPELELVLHAHRSPVAVDRVRAGECMLALVAGDPDAGDELSSEVLAEEPMVIVPSGLVRLPRGASRALEVMTIEPGSSTWRALKPRVARLRRERGIDLQVGRSLESFSSIVQLARAGFGHGLVPRAMAEALGVPADTLVELPGVSRPVRLVGRRLALSRPLLSALATRLRAAVLTAAPARRSRSTR